MIEINLLPPEYQRGRLPTIDSILIVILSALTIASLFGIAIASNGKVKAHKDIVKTFNKQIAPYKIQYKEIKVSQKRLKDIEERLPIIKHLVGDRVLWSDKLSAIYESIPKGVWLQELQIGQDRKKRVTSVNQDNAQKKTEGAEPEIKSPVVRISGFAKSFIELSQFMRNLDSSPLFYDATRFISASDTNFAYTSLLSFEIQARVVTSPHREPLTE